MGWNAEKLTRDWFTRGEKSPEEAMELIHLAIQGCKARDADEWVEIPEDITLKSIEDYAISKGIKISYEHVFDALIEYEDLDGWLASQWSC